MTQLRAHSAHSRTRVKRRARAAYQRGLTVIELAVVIALITVLAGIFYTGIRYVTGADLRENTTQVAAILRAAYNMSTTTGKHHRVVFDLDEQTYRIEKCEGDFTMRFSEREDVLEKGDLKDLEDLAKNGAKNFLPPEMAQAVSPEQAAKAAAAITGKRLGQAACSEPQLPTGDSDARGAQRSISTGDGVKIRNITVQHLEDTQANGIVHINFFPMGRAEKAVVELGSDDGDSYTLLVHGLTGRVEFHEGRIDPEDHMMRRADGEQADERRGERP